MSFFGGEAGSPSNTKPPGPRPTSVPSGILIDPSSDLATIDMGQKLGAVPFLEGRVGSPSNTAAWAEAYLHTKWHLNPSSHWPQLTWAENWGELCPLGGLGPHITQCGLDRGLPPCKVSASSMQPCGHNTPTLQREIQDRTTLR